MQPLDQALGLRVGGRQMTTFAASVPRNPWHSPVSSVRRPRHRPIAPSPSQTSTRGTAPSASISCHQPANRSCAAGSAPAPRRPTGNSRVTIVSTGSCFAVRTCPNPAGSLTGGNQKSHCAISPAAYVGPRRRVRRQIRRPQLRDPAAQRPDRVRPPDPLRDHRRRHRRIRRQQLPDPRLERVRHRPRRRPLDTSAAPHWPAPPSPCSARCPAPARSPRSACPPPAAAGGSQPSPPRSAPASSLARLEPGSRGSWSIFGCRAVVSIQLPSTPLRAAMLCAAVPEPAVRSASMKGCLRWDGGRRRGRTYEQRLLAFMKGPSRRNGDRASPRVPDPGSTSMKGRPLGDGDATMRGTCSPSPQLPR